MKTTTVVRDVSDEFIMPVDTYAAIFSIADGFAVAWGRGYDAMAENRCWDAHVNTPENGARFFRFLEDAEAHVNEVIEANGYNQLEQLHTPR